MYIHMYIYIYIYIYMMKIISLFHLMSIHYLLLCQLKTINIILDGIISDPGLGP